MKPVKIHGSGKSENHSSFILSKEQQFFSEFRQFLIDLGFDKDEFDVYKFGRPLDDQCEPIENKEDDIKNYTDKHFYFHNDQYDIDVVFGKDRIFVSINTKEDRQEEISEKLKKFVSFT